MARHLMVRHLMVRHFMVHHLMVRHFMVHPLMVHNLMVHRFMVRRFMVRHFMVPHASVRRNARSLIENPGRSSTEGGAPKMHENARFEHLEARAATVGGMAPPEWVHGYKGCGCVRAGDAFLYVSVTRWRPSCKVSLSDSSQNRAFWMLWHSLQDLLFWKVLGTRCCPRTAK